MFVDKREDLASPEQIMSMSGLDFMQGVKDGTIPAAPIARIMGYELHHIAEGEATFRGAPSFDTMNPIGSVHGGWYGVLLDSAMGCAVMTNLPKGTIYTTLEYKINIVRSIPLGVMIDAHAKTTHSGRSTAIASGEIRGVEDGRLYATGSTTCIVMTPKG